MLACAEGEAGLPVESWGEEVADDAPAANYGIAAPHELQPVKTTCVSCALQLQLAIDSSLFSGLSQ